MKTENIKYRVGDLTCHGYLAREESSTTDAKKRPAVIVAHAWMGQDQFARDKADELAKLGYVGFAADIYGEGRTAATAEQAGNLMQPLFLDRKELRRRMVAAYTEIKNHPEVDPTKISVIGFCFGGLAAIELFRSGEDLRGAVSFHGVLGSKLGDITAQLEPPKLPLKGAILLLHGYKDPMVSQEDLVNIEKEFSTANADWQLVIHGLAAHAFMNPEVNDTKHGLIYEPVTAKRSWQMMQNFLNEQFNH
ncbi:MAG: dienelactone hydrolase family protein [Parachlamydiaceae bacterium]|nr:dienelactone hydrolase family protein [Parachlamydiaceae bacterium]